MEKRAGIGKSEKQERGCLALLMLGILGILDLLGPLDLLDTLREPFLIHHR
jgi:hypothetical protein